MTNLYEQSGVNLQEADKLNKKLSSKLNIIDFAGSIDTSMGFNFVTCCDGIGSKIIPLYEKKMYKTIAIDVVAANLNDIICSGATAVGFVDYIAVNKLDSEAVSNIVENISKELQKCNCKLLGGETSEISELITEKNIDIAGFAVGLVKSGEEISKTNVCENDIVIGLCSSGIHANGFSLIRKFYKEGAISDLEFEGTLTSTYIYYNEILKLIKEKKIKACANITGGGIFSNLNRVISDGFFVELNFEKIPPQKIFEKLKQICGDEFWEVFNAGVGFCLIADSKNIKDIFETCKKFSPFVFGKIGVKK